MRRRLVLIPPADHFHHGLLDPHYTIVTVFIEGEWDDQKYASLMSDISDARWDTCGDSVFRCRCAIGCDGDTDVSIWALVFYENVGFMAVTLPTSSLSSP